MLVIRAFHLKRLLNFGNLCLKSFRTILITERLLNEIKPNKKMLIN
jgi:hypothetical protein